MNQLEQKQKDYNWYYTQVFLRKDMRGDEYGSYTLYFVTFATTPTEAKDIAKVYIEEHKPEGFSLETDKDIHFYQKNYIRESRQHVTAGRYAGVKPF